MIDPLLLLRVLLLLGIANGAPIFATRLLGERLGTPLDGGARLPDGQRILGAGKTIRGIVASIACTTLAAAILGFDWQVGAEVAVAAMVGDLASSFIKRRLRLRAHARALLLDQIPEALLPLLLLLLKARLGLTGIGIAVVLAAFIVLELALSRLLFQLHIRDRPY